MAPTARNFPEGTPTGAPGGQMAASPGHREKSDLTEPTSGQAVIVVIGNALITLYSS